MRAFEWILHPTNIVSCAAVLEILISCWQSPTEKGTITFLFEAFLTAQNGYPFICGQ